MEQPDAFEVAVVGGGVAGLYAVWRLAETGRVPAARVAVFEAGERTGGRLRSVRLAGADGLVAEAGGIAFHESHRHVCRLVDRLGLEMRDHATGSRRSLLNLRGRTLRNRKLRYQLVRPFAFGVARRTQIDGVGALLRTAAERIVPGFRDLAPEDQAPALRAATFSGKPLRDWPLRAALLRVLAPEEVRFLEAASGYTLFTDAPNAATGLALCVEELLMGGRFSVLTEGYQSLPLALAQLVDDAGSRVHLRHRLVAIDRGPDSFVLHFQAGDAGSTRVVTARNLILALPPKPVEAVSGAAALVGSRLLTAVTPWPMCVIALLYPSAWWARIGIERGRSLTDLPARQLWQFGRSEDRPGVLLSQSDGSGAVYWQAMTPTPGDRQGFAPIAPDSDVAQEMHRQVCSIYAPVLGRPIPPPQAGFFQDWGAPDYGGALHAWSRGVDPASIVDAAMRPSPDLPLFLSGEAWSGNHGWVEGAMSQTETLLQRHFALPPPPWLS